MSVQPRHFVCLNSRPEGELDTPVHPVAPPQREVAMSGPATTQAGITGLSITFGSA